jgi:tetratricopeptide (TPR) repeat protein
MSRSALVVGINQYPHLNSLHLPAQDAEAIAQLLETQGEFRITRLPEIVENEQEIIGKNTPVTTAQLKKALIQLFKPDSVQVPDVALFYFAGHGVRGSDGLDDGYLATSDTNLTSVWGLSLNWLRQLLQQSPIKTQIVWLDCCYSGALINLKEADPNDAGLARSRCFIAASRAYEVAYEEIAGHHGVLTNVLLQGLDCRHKDSVNNLELTAFIHQQLKTSTQAPVALNLGEAITLTFNRQQKTKTATLNANALCPYKGLFYFDCNETDAQNFYGRENLINELLAKISKDNFIAVLGASGSGKSSVVRAGLLYRLQTGQYINGSEQWQHLIFTPDKQPLESLAWAFVDKTQNQIEQAAQLTQALDLLKTADGFQALIKIKAAKSKLIICVDQFEELFTLCRDDEQREQFLALLLNTLPLLPEHYALIITLRADFFAQCTERDYHGLAKLIQLALCAVTPLNDAELRSAIVEPAQKLGVAIDDGLVQQIIEDSQEAVGYLPLLQDVLTTLWQQGLNLEHYIHVGGLYGALEQRADKVYNALSPEQQSVAQAVFLSLVKLGEGTQDTRRRAFKSELLSARCNEALLNQVLLILANERLIVTSALASRDAAQSLNETVLDIAHEALIQHWKSLRQWLTDNREFKTWRERLDFNAKDWHEAKQDSDCLLRGARLLEAEERLNKYKDDLNPQEIAFIQASLSLRQQEQREKTKRRRFWIGSLVVFSLSVSVLAGLSVWQYRKAEQQKQIALDVLSQFTYEIPKALASIPKTANITAYILQYNIESLEKIYDLNPNDENTQWKQAVNYGKVGDLYLTLLGDVNQALKFYQKFFNIMEKIALQDPNNVTAQWDLSVSFIKLGDIHLSLNQTDKALNYYQQALAVRQTIAQKNPTNSDAQHNLLASFQKLGDIHLGLNQTDKALNYYQQALEISQKIIQQDSSNLMAQRDLSVSFDRLGNIHLSLSQTDKALAYYQQALDIRQKIAQQDTSNSAVQRDLSVIFIKLGDINLSLNQTNKALDFYQKSSNILQKIAQQDPSNLASQRDLSVSFDKLGLLYKQLKQNKQALAFFQKALPIVERLAEDKLNYQAQQDLKEVQDAIESVSH